MLCCPKLVEGILGINIKNIYGAFVDGIHNK
jgi:hypothetical protein